jgi:NAD(P)-dependent dehydrogenase (short-subunit alcohol dehydrogenase family)
MRPPSEDRGLARTPLDRMDGKRVVITGATSGIGRATATALGRLGAEMFLVSRNQIRGTSLARRLSASGAATEFIAADLTSPAQVRAAADRIRERWQTIDVLINNAGARFDTYGSTRDGGERTFATNHLGHFLFTGLLLDRLTAGPAGRIITVASSAAAAAQNDGRWQSTAADFNRKQAYAKSKLANLLFAFELARRLRSTPVRVMAVDPGGVATRFALKNGIIPWLKHVVSHGLKRNLVMPAKGADTAVFLASAAVLPPNANGGLFRHRRPIPACAAASDPAAAASLWSLSVALTGIDPARDLACLQT